MMKNTSKINVSQIKCHLKFDFKIRSKKWLYSSVGGPNGIILIIYYKWTKVLSVKQPTLKVYIPFVTVMKDQEMDRKTVFLILQS